MLEIKVPSAVSSDDQSVLPCKHGVDQRNVALSTLPAVRDSILHLSFLPSWFDLLYVYLQSCSNMEWRVPWIVSYLGREAGTAY